MLVNVGEGTKEGDYAGKQVKADISVLVSAQAGRRVQDLGGGKIWGGGDCELCADTRMHGLGGAQDENLISLGGIWRTVFD